jgi:hypothetical protein
MESEGGQMRVSSFKFQDLDSRRLSTHLKPETWNLKPRTERAFRAAIPTSQDEATSAEVVRPLGEVLAGQRISRVGSPKNKIARPVSGIARRLNYYDRCARGCQVNFGE